MTLDTEYLSWEEFGKKWNEIFIENKNNKCPECGAPYKGMWQQYKGPEEGLGMIYCSAKFSCGTIYGYSPKKE
ncbi:MAG: hypothetical protein JW791_00170 [Nanoarchaeota archaeon]|nr:hypothetical protein [Nanoarchaeota archaeon]